MKTVKRALLTIVALAVTISLQAQTEYVGAKLEFVKLKPGKRNAFMELEKDIVKLQQTRVDRGIITRWALYEKMYHAADDPYQYVWVHLNDDFAKTENAYPQELINEMYTKEEQSEWGKKASGIRTIVKTEYYDRVATSDYQPYKYLSFTRYYVKPEDRGTFEKQRKEIVQPLFEEVVKHDHRAGWSLWRKDPNDKKFQYVAVNAFPEYGDWKTGGVPFEEIFKKLFPDMDYNETRDKVLGNRVEINNEYWELILETEPANTEE